MTIVASLAALGAASPAMASLRADTARFSDCPVENPEVSQCLYALTTSGEFIIGKSTVPISKTVTIQGGLTPPVLVSALDGNTLSKTPLPIPGGLTGIALPGEFNEVTSTAELAGTGEVGESVHLPLKVKLDNPALGSTCYLGSNTEPLTLSLTYGTTNPPPPNKPISGKGTVTTKDNGEIKVITGTLVDNSFSAPGANGCTAVPPVGDLAVNNKVGLPAAAGTNTAIMSGTTEEASTQIVKAVRPLPDIGRCVKVAGPALSAYGNATCTEESPGQGKFEWTEGPGPARKFSGVGTKVTLATVGGSSVICTASSNEGEYTGPKAATISLKLTGCTKASGKVKIACQSGATAGEIQTAALEGGLNFIKENEEPTAPVVGMDLKPVSGSTVASFECGGSSATVSGSVIAPISSIDKMVSSFKLKAAELGGVQSPEAFEEGAKDTLSFTPSGGSAEGAGLTTTTTNTNEEKLEIKAIL